MNLVAKEYVAAQNPTDPGVLVLSEFAGAAKELDAAVLVNPHDIDGMAQAIGRAFDMPLEERRARWNEMMGKLRNNTGQMWFEGFVKALTCARSVQPIVVPAAPAAAALTYLPERATAISS